MNKKTTKKKTAKKKVSKKKATPKPSAKETKRRDSIIESQLSAGGMVSTKAKVDPDVTERVVARRYTGSALGQRVVVRLTAERLEQAEDLAMEFIGLAAAGQSHSIGLRARGSLGFASWALVNHPENAKYALALVKQMKAAARRAAAKPGHAYDAHTEMAKELDRSVREFLPPFWEEVARTFKDIGNTTYAGRALGKALEAERVHGLHVDPVRRRDAVIEFALAGCLSGKALSDYAKDLQEQFEPDEAVATFKDLIIRRTLGGMPPVVGAAKDLTRLVKAAGGNVDDEIDSLLQEIISSPAMSKAPLAFWTSVDKNVRRIIADDDQFAAWLLVHTEPNPNGYYYGENPFGKKIALLKDWGVLDLLKRPANEFPDVELPGGRAGWVARVASSATPAHAIVFDLIESAAPAITGEDTPMPLKPGQRWGTLDADVLEYCLELDLPIEPLGATVELNLDGWQRKTSDHPRRGSSLANIATDDRFASMLQKAVTAKLTGTGARSHRPTNDHERSRFTVAAAQNEVVSKLWWEFIDHQLNSLESGALVDAVLAMQHLSGTASQAAEKFPEFVKRLGKIEMSAILARTIRCGVIDEYGWPALDDLADQCKMPSSMFVHFVFPYLTVSTTEKTYVLGPQGRKEMAGITKSKDQSFDSMMPVADDLCVIDRDTAHGYHSRVWWLSSPRDIHTLSDYLYYFEPHRLLPTEDGIFYGSRVLRPGDKKVPSTQHWLADHDRVWVLPANDAYHYSYHDDPDDLPVTQLCEIEPITGRRGSTSVPPMLQSPSQDGRVPVWAQSYLTPVTVPNDGSSVSPLGTKDGLIGWRCDRHRDGTLSGIGIDGRECRIAPSVYGAPSTAPVAMIDRPGGDGHFIICQGGHWIDSQTGQIFADGGNARMRQGQPLPLPHYFWHYAQIRDLAASKRLRKLNDKVAGQWLSAGQKEHEALKKKEDPANPDPDRLATTTTVEKTFGKIHTRLSQGLARLVRYAAEETISLSKLKNRATGGTDSSGKASEKTASKPERTEAEKLHKEQSSGLDPLCMAGVLASIQTNHYAQVTTTAAGRSHLVSVRRFLVDRQKAESDPEPIDDPSNDDAPKANSIESKLDKGDANWLSIIAAPDASLWSCFWTRAIRGWAGVPLLRERLGTNWTSAARLIADEGWLDLPGQLVLYYGEQDKTAVASTLNAARRRRRSSAPRRLIQGDRRYVVYPHENIYSSSNQYEILTYDPDGTAVPPDGLTITHTDTIQPAINADAIRKFCDLADSLEEVPLIAPEKLDAAAKSLNVSPISVALAWMANYRSHSYGQEKLVKPLREHYGWKVNEIKKAVMASDADPLPWSVISAGLRLAPGDCLGSKLDDAFDAFVDSWKEHRGSRVTMSPETAAVLSTLGNRYGGYDVVATTTDLLSNTDDAELLRPRTVRFRIDDSSRHTFSIGCKFEPQWPASTDEDAILSLPSVLEWINYSASVDDDARRRLPHVIEEVRDFFADPITTLPLGTNAIREGHDPAKIDFDKVSVGLGSVLGKPTTDETGITLFDNDLLLGGWQKCHIHLRFRPALLKRDVDRDLLMAADELTHRYPDDYPEYYRLNTQAVDVVDFFRGDDAESIITANSDPSPAIGCWDQNPSSSAPTLVSEVAKKLSIATESAVLYLQVLSLPDPTTKNIAAWNSWKPAAIKTAVKELVDVGHLIAAKRSRAGRYFFLPGGWEALKAPNLPIETWKLSDYGITDSTSLRGGAAKRLILPRSCAAQFARTWQRVQSGDQPKYEAAAV